MKPLNHDAGSAATSHDVPKRFGSFGLVFESNQEAEAGMVIDGAEKVLVTTAHRRKVEHPKVEGDELSGGSDLGDVGARALLVGYPAETVGTSIVENV